MKGFNIEPVDAYWRPLFEITNSEVPRTFYFYCETWVDYIAKLHTVISVIKLSDPLYLHFHQHIFSWPLPAPLHTMTHRFPCPHLDRGPLFLMIQW